MVCGVEINITARIKKTSVVLFVLKCGENTGMTGF